MKDLQVIEILEQTDSFKRLFQKEMRALHEREWVLDSVRRQNILLWREVRNLKYAREILG